MFVDLCLLLVSIRRRESRIGGLVEKMRQAEDAPVIDILTRFHAIHEDPQVRENFELFRHVVFDLNGDYYAAVPLDAPPRMNPQAREVLRRETLLLSNLFTGFEKERFFSRVLMPYITTNQIQKRLWRQGSKFAHSESFRLYKFRDGAWSEFILGAVMGAGRKMEAVRGDLLRTTPPDQRREPHFGAMNPNTAASRDAMWAGHGGPATVARSEPAPTWYMPPPAPFNRTQQAPRAAEAPVADLAEHKRRLAEAAEVHVTAAANSNTAPTRPDAGLAPTMPPMAPTVAEGTTIQPATVVAAAAPEGAIKVEAVERTLTWHVPQDSPLRAPLARIEAAAAADQAAGSHPALPAAPAQTPAAEAPQEIAVDRIASRFRPEASQG